MSIADRSPRVEFLYLQQEDCIRAGGLDMQGTMKAVERSFFLHGQNAYIQPGKPVIRWGGPETEETTGRIMSMPSFLGGEQFAEELRERTCSGRWRQPASSGSPAGRITQRNTGCRGPTR